MKKMMLTIVLLSFFSLWMLPADSRMIPPRFNVSNPEEGQRDLAPPDTIPLSMVEHSVDDMYDGCDERMGELVRDTYMNVSKEDNELKGHFKSVWDTCTNVKEVDSKTDLTKNHIRAICTWISGKANKNFFEKLTRDVVKDRKEYATTSFKYHSMHFLLTRAIQILKKSQAGCQITYRRTDIDFTDGLIDQIIRFGHFASSSFVSSLTQFGKETCFNITTCYGAALNQYARGMQREKEVLIPPYELFKIVNIQKKDECEIADCNTFITLESVGFLSNLNCALTK